MDALLKKTNDEYEKIISSVLNKNLSFVNKDHTLLYEFENQKFVKGIIPKINPPPLYRYYVNSTIDISGTDDPVLRFVPYINSDKL